MQPSLKALVIGARNSPLSHKQVEEVCQQIHIYAPHITFQTLYVDTVGDKDKITSLRTLDKKSDFFTREIDHMLLNKTCRIAIHSAKDLPEPLAQGLILAALTRGVDPSDALVLRPHEIFPPQGIVATSSLRREENVRLLFPQARFVDLRGTIGERIGKLDSKEVDGVVVAEAALIRLQLTHLNRIIIPGPTAHLQGKLAIVTREDDIEMCNFLAAAIKK